MNLFQQLEEQLGYKFRNQQLLIQALTFPSTAREKHTQDYEKLEFVGDALITLIIKEHLNHSSPDKPLATLVPLHDLLICKEMQVFIAGELNLYKWLSLTNIHYSEEEDPVINKKKLSDVIEAIVAAIYYDSHTQLSQVRQVVTSLFIDNLESYLKIHNEDVINWRGKLQILGIKICRLKGLKNNGIFAEPELMAIRTEQKLSNACYCIKFLGVQYEPGQDKESKKAKQLAAKNAYLQLCQEYPYLV